MNRFIPGFTMFRNAYGKISPALPLIYALLIGSSLQVILVNIKDNSRKKIIISFMILMTILNAMPFVLNRYFANPIWTTKNTYSTIHDFNHDFYDLMSYISTIKEDSNFIWMPLSIFGYVPIQDSKLSNHYYSGLSPVEFLGKKTDIAGTSLLPGSYPSEFVNNLFTENFKEIGKEIQTMNINYMIVNNSISSDLRKSYLYGINRTADLYDYQYNYLVKELAGEKIRSFGKRYDLYKINDLYQSTKIFTSKNDSFTQEKNFGDMSYQTIAPYEYHISLKNLNSKMNLIFLDPYNPYWKLYLGNLNKNILINNHKSVFGYANKWEINEKEIKQGYKNLYQQNNNGTIDLNLTLYFEPQKYFYTAFIISVLSVVLSSLCFGVFILRRFYLSIFKRTF